MLGFICAAGACPLAPTSQKTKYQDKYAEE